jgi:hypothetical protein
VAYCLQDAIDRLAEVDASMAGCLYEERRRPRLNS